MRDPNYPALKWDHATGEARRFDAAEEVPDGWLDRPVDPNAPPAPSPAPTPAPTPAVQAMARAEMKAALDAGGISYAKNAPDKTLYELLLASLKDHLAAAAVEFDPDADAPALLALVKAQSPTE